MLMAALIRTRLSFLRTSRSSDDGVPAGNRPVFAHKKAGAAGTPISGMLATPAIWYLAFGSVAR